MRYVHICHRCGNSFTASTPNRSYCSKTCQRNPKRPCVICGKLFHNSHAEVACCSIACGGVAKRRKRQDEIERRFGEPVRDLIWRLYYTEERPVRECANIIGVSSRNLFEWFYDLSIPRRDRSTAVEMQWKDNDGRRKAAADQARRDLVPSSLDERRERSAIAMRALQKRRGPTSIERRMMQALDCAGIAYEFQYTIAEKFLCDFVFPHAMLVVECDGAYWHSKPRQQRIDASKDAYLRKCGYTVIRFSDAQIKKGIHDCAAAIIQHLDQFG